MSATTNTAETPAISSSLEDYLETIYLHVQEQGFSRVKDIARQRDVTAASVSVALRKLAELELIRYERREYIALTASGEQAARRVLSRHQLLTRFFEQVLQMPAGAASEQACAMEHSLTDDAMGRLARFFEFLGTRPQVIEEFRQRQNSQDGGAADEAQADEAASLPTLDPEVSPMSLSAMQPGQKAKISQITASGALRQRLLDMGMLPDAVIDLERVGLGGDPLWIRCQGAQLALRRSEAALVLVRDIA